MEPGRTVAWWGAAGDDASDEEWEVGAEIADAASWPFARVGFGTLALGLGVLLVALVRADAAASRAPAALTTTERAAIWVADDRLAYAGRDASGRPRYVQRAFTADERRLVRLAFGVSDPNRLYLADSTPGAVLVYDSQLPSECVRPAVARTRSASAVRCARVNSHRVGAPSLRRSGETWEAFEQRLWRMERADFPAEAFGYVRSLDALAPDARLFVGGLLERARRAGFRVRVEETYRAPGRQAFLLRTTPEVTRTATSAHADGRALDVVIGDGRLTNAATMREWIGFRRWLLAHGGGRIRLVGAPDQTWDWPHLEVVGPTTGFATVDELIAAARACVGPAAAATRGAASPRPACAGRTTRPNDAPRIDPDGSQVAAFARDLEATGQAGAHRAWTIARMAVRQAHAHGLPPTLLLGVMLVENARLDSRAVSSAGAQGLMQVHPLWRAVLGPRHGFDLTADSTNLAMGAHILADVLSRAQSVDDVERGLLRYNGCRRAVATPRLPGRRGYRASCAGYAHRVRRQVEAQAPTLCPSRSFADCVTRPLQLGGGERPAE